MVPPKDYLAENEMRRKAIEIENEFLKKEVLGQGVADTRETGAQNIQSDMERAIDGDIENERTT